MGVVSIFKEVALCLLFASYAAAALTAAAVAAAAFAAAAAAAASGDGVMPWGGVV